MLWQSQLLSWPPPPKPKKKPHACAHAKEAIHGHSGAGGRGREGGRKECSAGGGSFVNCVRPGTSEPANAHWAGDGQRYRIADTEWGRDM